MDGNEELKKLTELLRIGLATVREIAQKREDFDRLMDISNRSEVIADELDEITAEHERTRNIQ